MRIAPGLKRRRKQPETLACGIEPAAICTASCGESLLKLSENLRILLYFCYAMRLPFY
jgi:hypothetical protein